MGFRFPALKRLILIFLLTLSLTVVIPSASAQMLFTPGSGNGDATRAASNTPWWDINKGRRCGRLWCADVFLRGSSQVTLTVGLIPEPEEFPQAAANAVENRAKQVESVFDSIYSKLISVHNVEAPPISVHLLRSKVFDLMESSLGDYPNPSNLQEYSPQSPPTEVEYPPLAPEVRGEEHTSIERRTPATSLRDSAIRIISSPITEHDNFPADEIHPLTPRVEVGIQNNETVIFVPEQPELGITSQTIVTVNHADELINGQTINVLAHKWRNRIHNSFDKALWGYELDRQYPWSRYYLVATFASIVLVAITLMGFLRSFFRRRERYLRQQLKLLAESITHDIEAEAIDPLSLADQESENELYDGELENPPLKNHDQRENNGTGNQPTAKKTGQKLAWLFSSPNSILPASKSLKKRANYAWQNIGDLANNTLRRQTLIKQRSNLAVLMSWVLLWLQVSCVFITIAFIAYIFPSTRPYTLLFIGQAMYFPILWISITLIDKIAGIFIDGCLNNWAKEQQQYKGQSNRYTLRVMTYSPAIKGGISILLTILGFLGTVWLFGINPMVLASFGGVAFVIAFLGRNVVEDMLNGTLILWTDRYAIGDVVQIGDVFGLVENMSIYITHLRGPEGRLSTIPNGQISVVQNLTKDWSRAEFIVEIDQSSDVDKALDVIKVVSEKMREDPVWEDKILEPAAILGVDNIASQGIKIQVWIKTQAGQHWPVGREFRLRMKKAFELAGIDLGAPHQRIIYHHQESNGHNHNPAIATPKTGMANGN